MAFLDPGSGRVPQDTSTGPDRGRVTPIEACKRGDILGYRPENEDPAGWVKAFAKTAEVVQGRLVALEDCALKADGVTYPTIAVSPNPTLDGYSHIEAGVPPVTYEAVPGGYVYVDEATGREGRVTQTIPTDSGDATTIIGIALTADRILFFLNARADSVVA